MDYEFMWCIMNLQVWVYKELSYVTESSLVSNLTFSGTSQTAFKKYFIFSLLLLPWGSFHILIFQRLPISILYWHGQFGSFFSPLATLLSFDYIVLSTRVWHTLREWLRHLPRFTLLSQECIYGAAVGTSLVISSTLINALWWKLTQHWPSGIVKNQKSKVPCIFLDKWRELLFCSQSICCSHCHALPYNQENHSFPSKEEGWRWASWHAKQIQTEGLRKAVNAMES